MHMGFKLYLSAIFLFQFSMYSLFPHTCQVSVLHFPVLFISHYRKLFTPFFCGFLSVDYDTNVTMSTYKLYTLLYNYINVVIYLNPRNM